MLTRGQAIQHLLNETSIQLSMKYTSSWSIIRNKNSLETTLSLVPVHEKHKKKQCVEAATAGNTQPRCWTTQKIQACIRGNKF